MALTRREPKDRRTLNLPFAKPKTTPLLAAGAANDNAETELARRREAEREEDAAEQRRLYTRPGPAEVAAWFRPRRGR